MENTTRLAWAEIDLSAIRHNINQVKNKVGDNVRIMAVVKANAYGHGAERVAKTAIEAGADFLGVAIAEEGDALRASGITKPILILAEPALAAIELVAKNELISAVCTKRTADALSAAAQKYGKTLKVHVKVDTGMSRIGLEPKNVKEFINYLSDLPGIEIEGIFTHFTESDNKESQFTAYQLDRFMLVIDDLNSEGVCPPIKHAANSAGIFLHPASHLDMVRLGISMYGLHPSNDTKDVVDLRPALSLKARISFIKNLKAKNGVSYNRTYVTSCDTVIATIPIGYGDGYTRKLSNKASAIIRGQKCRAVGNICMDQFMVELNDGMDAAADDEVILIGRQGDQEITVDEVANLVGTINYEIVCMVNTRVPRVYKG